MIERDFSEEAIVAPATPPGQGGVAVVRISAKSVSKFISNICAKQLSPRKAIFCDFHHSKLGIVDSGLAIYFPAPNSFTGEDVLELQCHGSPMVVDCLLEAAVACGARLAKPGEFSLRAFLNDKLDLTQAEAIADLIHSQTKAQMSAAFKSLQGSFSKTINLFATELLELRKYVEACLDFPEEEIDFLKQGQVAQKVSALHTRLSEVLSDAEQAVHLQSGIQLLILGPPNAGKSSLLNCLSQQDKAIVTAIPGTTRDMIENDIAIAGFPIKIVDTAGIRETDDIVEQQGISRALDKLPQADLILLVVEQNTNFNKTIEYLLTKINQHHASNKTILIAANKADQNKIAMAEEYSAYKIISISALHETGIEQLKQQILNCLNLNTKIAPAYIARRRHINLLAQAKDFIEVAVQLCKLEPEGELIAENLLQAHNCLAEIVGRVTPDDLLGHIFSDFCIGK